MKRSASKVFPTPDGPIRSVESPRGMPPPIALSSLSRPNGARLSSVGTRRGSVVSKRGNTSIPRPLIWKLCWPGTLSAPRIFRTRSQRRSTGPCASFSSWMIASATANSGSERVSAPEYSPTRMSTASV